jgi:DNA-nicking Smr family endonuclease
VKRKGLSEEDKALWKKVSETADPLHPEKPKIIPPAERPLPMPKPVEVKAAHIEPFELGTKAKPKSKPNDLMPSISDRVSAQPVQMDKKAYGRMTKGKLTPEARIDLHGMTLDQAHPALVGFVMRSYSEGKRLILVITGKGKSKQDDGPIPVRRGVLKHQVPQWLQMAPLRPVVLQVREAHLKHGGSGAYYVYLRRKA